MHAPAMASAAPVALIIVWALAARAILCSASPLKDCVRDLVAEPDYRAVRLKWTCDRVDGLAAFHIKYCEITHWPSKNRCKEQTSKLGARTEHSAADIDEAVVSLSRTGPHTFEASIANLRMLTNYSWSVWSQINETGSVETPQASQSQVSVETKSFAAKTSRCLANSSDIEVQTGPYFRGKISVEGSSNAACAIFGNRSSEQGVYVLTINHDLCNSKMINNSRIETMVIVHENKEILTHNSRRYMVVCTFAPEIYSLTASVAVPSHLLKKVFDRLRDRQVHVSLGHRNAEAPNALNNEVASNTVSISKVPKKKRFSVRREALRSDKLSHLRDSRMLAEDSRAKWLRLAQPGTESQARSHNYTAKWGKFLTTNQVALSLVMAVCAVVLLCLLINQLRFGRKVQVKSDPMQAEQQQDQLEQGSHGPASQRTNCSQ